MYQQQHIEFIIQKAKKRLDQQEAPGCTKAGWLMITALLIESWDIYSMAFILFALKDIYEPSSWLLGFTAAGTQLGAVVGALLGGWLTDKLGRRKIFLWSMILFAIFAVLQGLAPNMYWLAIIRCLAGIPVGADVANGFTYIMEVMPKGKREVMANRWQFMFALGIIAAILLVTTLVALDVHPDMIWRIVLAVPAIPACLLLFMRRELPETPAWFVERGRFIEAKQASRDYYGEQDGRLLDDILPNENVTIADPTLKETLHDLFRRPFTRRTTLFGWFSCAVQSFENYAFSFFLPLAWFAKTYVNVFRSIPLVMVLLWFYLIVPGFLQNVLGLSPKTDIRLISAMIAFSMFEAAYYSEIIRAGIQSISRGQSSAALALGMTHWQSMKLVILPQAFRAMVPLLLTQGIVLFQDTSLVYVLSLADFFRTASTIGERDGTQVEMILFAGAVYFVFSLSASLLVSWLKKRTV